MNFLTNRSRFRAWFEAGIRHGMKTFVALLFCPLLAASAAEFPVAADMIGDCENKWTLLVGKDPSERVLGFTYVDSMAGVTLRYKTTVALGENGVLVQKQSPLEGKTDLIIRITKNYRVSCLSDAQVVQLGLPREPEWLVFYRDERPAGLHNESWATHYNAIQAPETALKYVRRAIDAGYSSPVLAFEHSFALNALGRFKEALDVLGPAVQTYPDDSLLLAEQAFAVLCLGEYRRSIALFEAAIAKAGDDKTRRRRSDYANNIANAYQQLGETGPTQEWREKARKWYAEVQARTVNPAGGVQ